MISFQLLFMVLVLLLLVQGVVLLLLLPVVEGQSYNNNINNVTTIGTSRSRYNTQRYQRKCYHQHHHRQYEERTTIESINNNSNNTNDKANNNNNSDYSYSYYYYDYYYIIVLNDNTSRIIYTVYDAYYEIQQLVVTQVSIINNRTTLNSTTITNTTNTDTTMNSNSNTNNNTNSNTNVSVVTNLIQPYQSIKSIIIHLQLQIIIVSTNTINDDNNTTGSTSITNDGNNSNDSTNANTNNSSNTISNSSTVGTTTTITKKMTNSTIINNRNDIILKEYHEFLLRALVNSPLVLSIEEDQSFPISYIESTEQPPDSVTTKTTTKTTNITTSSSNDIDTSTSPTGTNISYQYNPLSWGLDRVDQLYLPLDGLYHYSNWTTTTTTTTGSTSTSRSSKNNNNTVHVYIIGTGIDTNHTEFVQRSNTTTKKSKIVNCINVLISNITKDNTNDNMNSVQQQEQQQCDKITNGHDTHIAGIIGGRTYGVAKQHVTIMGLQVTTTRTTTPPTTTELEEQSSSNTSTGTISSVLLGIEYILNKQYGTINGSSNSKSIVVLPIISTYSSALYNAINTLLQANVLVVVPAGDDNIDSCQINDVSVLLSSTTKEAATTTATTRTTTINLMYPSGVVTVAATDRNDYKSKFSNWGSCIDIYAPGSDITSSWIIAKSTNASSTSTATSKNAGRNNTTKSMSSTSIAAGYVSGVAVLYWSSEYYNTISSSSSSTKLITQIINDGTKGIVFNNTSNSPNVLLSTYNLLKLTNPNIIITTVPNNKSNTTNTNETITTTSELSSGGATIITTTYWYNSCWSVALVLLCVCSVMS